MKSYFLLALFIIGLSLCSAQLTAEFHMLGVTGSAQFVATGNNVVSVTMQLSGPSLGPEQSTSVEIRPIWVEYDHDDKCSTSLLGTAKTGMSTTLVNNVATFQGVSDLNSLEGQSIVLIGTSLTVCATIKRDKDYRTAVAYFKDKVFGAVYLRQETTSTFPTRLVSDLSSADREFRIGLWRISDEGSDCISASASARVFNPSSSDGVGCGLSSTELCEVGNLSEKHGNITVGTNQGDARIGFTDSTLPLGGDKSVIDKLLLIIPSSGNGSPACAVIRLYTGHSAVAAFNHDGIIGSLTFSQPSPLDPTTTSVDLQGLNNKAGGYHVHLWPTPTKAEKDQALCSPAVVSGHFNPYGKDPTLATYPAPNASTDDMYEIGDLSAKYGTLQGLDRINHTFSDWNLPLFGSNSIIGRSVVIHRDDATASRWVCTNIELTDLPVIAIATFKYPVIGHIMFMQETNKPDEETSIFAKLDYNDGRSGTQGNKWMVNSEEIQNDMLETDEMMRCKSTGSWFNPLNQWLDLTESSSLYDDYCNNNRPFACETGDLSGRLGPLSIRNSAAQGDRATRYFFTDMKLPLSGPHSVIGKPVVIKNEENNAIISCANIQILHSPKLSATFSMGGLSGMVEFSQTAGLGAVKTKVMNKLSGLASSHRLRIYDLPPLDGENPCSDLGAIYNPLEVQQDPLAGSTDDKYKVGDLTRHGINQAWESHNLPLTGRTSIMGRSLVVVDANNNYQVVACAKILPHLPDSTSQHVMATSTFTGDINGTIHLFQALYSDGTMSDTSIVVNLKSKNGAQTPNHNWHTHIAPVQGDNQAATDRCLSTSGHFDPYMAFANKSNYEVECMATNPLRCEVGDQAQKLKPYSLGDGRKVFTDVDLPLAGRYSVQGRSVVVHMANRAAPRQDCADIIPVTADPIEVAFRTPDKFDKRKAAEMYAGAVRADPENVVVEFISETDGITTVHVHFLGLERANRRSQFMEILNDEDKRGNLGIYAPYVSSAGTQVLSILLSLIVLGIHLMALA